MKILKFCLSLKLWVYVTQIFNENKLFLQGKTQYDMTTTVKMIKKTHWLHIKIVIQLGAGDIMTEKVDVFSLEIFTGSALALE